MSNELGKPIDPHWHKTLPGFRNRKELDAFKAELSRLAGEPDPEQDFDEAQFPLLQPDSECFPQVNVTQMNHLTLHRLGVPNATREQVMQNHETILKKRELMFVNALQEHFHQRRNGKT